MNSGLYSIRMRASAKGEHLSGAERIVPFPELDQTAAELRSRAMSKTREPDRIVITIESLHAENLPLLPSLPITTMAPNNVMEAREEAIRRLEQAGVSADTARTAILLLDNGAGGRGRTMRGAVIMTAGKGLRLEPDQERGIRVSRFDWSGEALPLAERRLAAAGLGHFRTKEALALATKVAHAPGILAELCWSDDPEYTAGYVASRDQGYIRFPLLKARGRAFGGRVFFVPDEKIDLAACVEYLERRAVLIRWGAS